MKLKIKLLVAALLASSLALLLSSCGEAELPHVGENGNWFVGDVDTGVAAKGDVGDTGAKGDVGDAGTNGTNGAKGDAGDDGAMPIVTGYEKISSSGLKDTYKISFSDGTTAEIEVTNSDKNGTDATLPAVDGIASRIDGAASAAKTAASLAAGESLVLPEALYQPLMSRRVITFSAKLDTLEDATVTIGHGRDSLGGTYLVVDKSYVTIYVNVGAEEAPAKLAIVKHGLEIEGTLGVVIDAGFGTATVSLVSRSGSFDLKDCVWTGSAGAPFVSTNGVTLDSVSLRFANCSVTSPVWVFADSSTSANVVELWEYYLAKCSTQGVMIVSSPDMTSERALADLEELLALGTPDYVVWALGSNEADILGVPSPTYATNLASLIVKCTERGISPVLVSVPNVAGNNAAKNTFIAETATTYGLKFVDLDAALTTSGAWNTYLYEDGELSAKRIALRTFSAYLSCVPELFNGR